VLAGLGHAHQGEQAVRRAFGVVGCTRPALWPPRTLPGASPTRPIGFRNLRRGGGESLAYRTYVVLRQLTHHRRGQACLAQGPIHRPESDGVRNCFGACEC
jgi:hypothetical protein